MKEAYRKNNPQAIRDTQNAYRAKNREYFRKYNKEYKERNPEIFRKANLKRNHFTPEIYDTLLALQNNKCAICDVSFSDIPNKQIHADHCHATKTPRGVLCHGCNTGLGAFKDDLERLERALVYLKSPTAKKLDHG